MKFTKKISCLIFLLINLEINSKATYANTYHEIKNINIIEEKVSPPTLLEKIKLTIDDNNIDKPTRRNLLF
jgi:hypothetical protein